MYVQCVVICAAVMAQTVFGGTAYLNGPQIQTSDLRRIDSFVSANLPIYPKGFQLYSGAAGSRPIIIKRIDPERTSAPLPNAGYYTNLPAFIPQGLEGLATTSFNLGAPLVTEVQQQRQQQQQQQQEQARQIPQPSIRVENSIGANAVNNEAQAPSARTNVGEAPEAAQDFRNAVVEATAEYEASLPQDLRNPFYSNPQTAEGLARASLPAPEEELVTEWNTRRIQEGKVRDLLSSAGLLNGQ